jgi:hypothetical protein
MLKQLLLRFKGLILSQKEYCSMYTEKEFRYPLDRRLDGPYSRSAGGVERNILSFTGIGYS